MIRKSLLAGLGVALLAATIPAAAQKMDLKELLARHAQSLKKSGTPALASRSVAGTVEMTVVVGGSGTLAGALQLLSAGEKRRLEMNFGHASYDHERVITDGNKISVDQVNAARRSDLGLFLFTQDQVFKEGLLGGVLSSAWPLAGGTEQKGSMKYEGLKKIEDKEFHVIRYRTRSKSSDVEIKLYFDPQTFCHIRTSYLVTKGPGIGPGGETESARQQTSRFRLEEEFADFRNSDGYLVPARWKIRYTTETEQSRIWEWVVNVAAVKNNPSIEAAQFEVK